jgi:ribonuclease-3
VNSLVDLLEWEKTGGCVNPHEKNEKTKRFLTELGLRVSEEHLSTFVIAMTPPTRRSENNRKLELLGDALLLANVIEILVNENPDKSIGFISKRREQVVSNRKLMGVAEKLNLTPYLLTDYPPRPCTPSYENALASTLEALVAAVYLSLGFQACKLFIREQIWPKIQVGKIPPAKLHPKEMLLHVCKEQGLRKPHYATRDLSRGRRPKWEAKVHSGIMVLSTATATSKSDAETKAALGAIEYVNGLGSPRKSKKHGRRKPSQAR